MRCKRFLIFIIALILINTISAEITQTKTIENFAWEQDSNLNNALKLKDYFSSADELSFSYEVISPTTAISPLQIEISNDNAGDVNFRSPEASFIGEKYIVFIATNSTGELRSNTVMLNVTRKISSSVSQPQETNFSITSASPSSEALNIYLGDIQMFGITVSTAENTTITWYVDTEIKKQGDENTFSFTPEAIGTFTIKASLRLGTKSIENRWTVTVQEKTAAPVAQQTPPAQTIPEPVCGNNIKDSGENCENCPQDVVCASNAKCTNGICMPIESGSSFLSIFIFILIPLLILAGAGFFAYKKGLLDKFIKKQEKTAAQPLSTKKLDISVLKAYFEENLKKGFKIEDLKKAAMGRGWSMEDIEKVLPKSSLEPLKNYIKENLKKGYTKQQLEQISLQTGWTKEQIAQAFAEIENDNTQGNSSTDTSLS